MQEISSTTDGSTATQNTKVCHEHLDQPLFFFCETCSIAICRDCTVVAHDKTAGHSIVRIKDVVVVHRRALEDQLQESHAARAQIQKSTQQLGSCIEKLQADKDYAIGNLKSMITFAREQLQLCEQQVTDAIIQHHEAQHGAMLDKQHELYQTSSMLDKRINQSEELMKTGDITDIISITEKLKAATGNAKADSNIFEVRNKWLASDLITGASPLNDKLCHLGKKCLETSLPTNFVLENNKVTAGLKSTFTLELKNIDDTEVAITACFLTVTVTDPFKKTLPVTLSATDPQYTVTFTPSRSGKHALDVRYLGQKLMSKQADIFVDSNNPVSKIGGPGKGNGTFNSPRGIVIDDNNCLYVADTGNGLIQKFSAGGEFLSQFRVNENKEDHTTFDIALDLNNGLLICTEILIEDSFTVEGSTLLLFNINGELLQTFTLANTSCPLNVAVNSRGNLLVSDIKEECVFEVDRKGNILNRMGDFKCPSYICFGGDDTAIVADTSNHCVYMLNPDGPVKRCVGSYGSLNGQLIRPFGVATDGDNILVADADNKRVQVFKYDGTPSFIIESKGDPLNEPRGLAITEDGYVYVVDRDNHCIKKYQYMGTPP